MTISSDETRTAATGNGVTTAFNGPYVLQAEDLKVYVDGELVDDADYTVGDVGNEAGTTVTFDSAPTSETNGVVIIRDPELIQPAVYTEGGSFPAATHEAEQDRGRMIDQTLAHRVARSLRVPDHESAIPELPAAGDRAGLIPAFNSDGSDFDMIAVGSVHRVAANYTALRGLLTALSAIAVGAVVSVAAADGSTIGGGFFRYEGAGYTAGDDDGGTFIVDALGNGFERIYDGPMQTSWFGAVRDGVANDTAAIQAALDSANDQGGAEISVGPAWAVSLIRDTLTVYDGIEISGYGTVKADAANWAGGAESPMFTNENYDAVALTDTAIKFRDLTIDGDEYTTGGGNHAVRMRMAQHVRFVDVHFQNVENGTALLACSDTWTDRCFAINMANCGFDHWDGCVGVKVTDCTVDGSPGQGIQFTGTGTLGEDRNSYDFVCTGNTVKNVKNSNAATAINVNANDAGSSVALARIANNYVDTCDIAYAISGDGNGFMVVWNIAKNCSNTGFLCQQDGGNYPDGITLIGHKVIDCNTLTLAVIDFLGGSNHIVSDCTVEGGTFNYAVSMAGSDNWKLSNNRLAAGSLGYVNAGSATTYAIDGCSYGTWTPELRFGGATTGIAYVRRAGIWTKIGRNVKVVAEFLLSSAGSATGSASIAGLPFAAVQFGSSQNQAAGVVVAYADMALISVPGHPIGIIAAASELYLFGYATLNSAQMAHSNFTNNTRLRFEASYICNIGA